MTMSMRPWRSKSTLCGLPCTTLFTRVHATPAADNTRAVLLNGYIVPGITTRRISTTVEMKDGDVLVIGGVKQREVNKVTSKFPILGDIPLVSLLFKHSKTETLDRDLVIVVSPQIVRQLARTFPKNLPGEEREGGR